MFNRVCRVHGSPDPATYLALIRHPEIVSRLSHRSSCPFARMLLAFTKRDGKMIVIQKLIIAKERLEPCVSVILLDFFVKIFAYRFCVN